MEDFEYRKVEIAPGYYLILKRDMDCMKRGIWKVLRVEEVES